MFLERVDFSRNFKHMEDEMRQPTRLRKLVLIADFIAGASLEECICLMEGIQERDILCVFNAKTKSLDSVTSVCVNGRNIQLNVEEDHEKL